MRKQLFSKLITVWFLVLASLVLNLTTACGHDPEHYNETARRAVEQRVCPANAFCKTNEVN